jgi:hypothetical protein
LSTTFDVYPASATIPTFEELLVRSAAHLHQYLVDHGIDMRLLIGANLILKQGCDGEGSNIERRSPLPWSPLHWEEKDYAWFTVGDVPGGTDAYFLLNDETDLIACHEAPRSNVLASHIRQCLAVGHHWSFRRSAGQSATINLTYGLLAASLAELTSGFVISTDGAWDHERMPALPEEFLTWYFKPELALEASKREWSSRCIAYLREELLAHSG